MGRIWSRAELVVAFGLFCSCSGQAGQPSIAPTPLATAPASPTTAGHTATTIDGYGADPFVVSGTREEVCRGGGAADRPGRRALAEHLKQAWPAVLDVQGYDCREIRDSTQAVCDGEVEPVRSDCWSTHAAGRAIDVMVGGEPDVPTAEGAALGDRIVTSFLAPEDGVPHRLARTTGVQEIIWNGRCWRPRDADVDSATTMEPCSIPGHANHVHLTLSDAGADGTTSWHRR